VSPAALYVTLAALTLACIPVVTVGRTGRGADGRDAAP
jgi:hypothetical protein